MKNKTINKINSLPSASSVILFGTGEAAKNFYHLVDSLKLNIKIIAFCDSFKTGTFFGKEIISSKKIKEYDVDFVLIASAQFTEIINSLNELDISNYLILGKSLIKNHSISRVLRSGPSASITSVIKKFGSIEPLKETYFIKDCTDFVLHYCPNGRVNGLFPFENNFHFYEFCSPKNKLWEIVKSVYVLCKLIRKYKIDFVHANGIYYFNIALLLAAKIMHQPFVVSIHADIVGRTGAVFYVPIFGSTYISKTIEKLLYKYADLVLPIRESLIDNVEKAGSDSTKIRVFPHGMDLSVFDAPMDADFLKKLGIPASSKIISSVCRLEEENYAGDILEIAKKTVLSNPEIYFVIVGEGSMLDSIRRDVDSLGLNKRILVLGAKDKDFVISLRKHSYINLCLMGGFSLIEACASGNPVISYDVEWHYELVENDYSGYLVSEHNIDTVVEKIKMLLADEKKALFLGENAKKLAFEKHNLPEVMKKKKEIYTEARLNFESRR